ncbi:hypothetical protein [Corynebacterium jeddahense]|uniref:hypothetical protein n=1 Tax=Corynebacterium jeddahense TaxID=1414719 RepID=UPI0004B4AF76|nr:hypothetical protein [Corynebacterium jeddahense]
MTIAPALDGDELAAFGSSPPGRYHSPERMRSMSFSCMRARVAGKIHAAFNSGWAVVRLSVEK